MKQTRINIAAVGDIALLKKPENEIYSNVWHGADIRIGNLEAPIVEYATDKANKPICLKQPKEAAEWLKEMDITAVTLANNHMFDWGVDGFLETIKFLKENQILCAGAGLNLSEAAKPVMFSVKGKRICLLSWACTIPKGYQASEYHPGIAGIGVKNSYKIDTDIADEQPGTPPIVHTKVVEQDIRSLEKTIKEYQTVSDYMILSIHWGVPPHWNSGIQNPIADYQRELSCLMADMGVDLVMGHHAHTPFGIESFPSKTADHIMPVVYSLGNFIFHHEYMPGGFDISEGLTMPKLISENHHSCVLGIELTTEEGSENLRLEKLTMTPIILNTHGEGIEPTQLQKTNILERLYEFSHERHTELKWEADSLVFELN